MLSPLLSEEGCPQPRTMKVRGQGRGGLIKKTRGRKARVYKLVGERFEAEGASHEQSIAAGNERGQFSNVRAVQEPVSNAHKTRYC